MRTPRARAAGRVVLLGVVVLGAAALVLGAGGAGSPPRTPPWGATTLRRLARGAGPHADVGQRGVVVLKAASLVPRLEQASGAGHRPEVMLPGFDGRGVTIALLDTGVDKAQPFLRGRVQEGINVLSDGDFHALAATKPDDATRLERHGTEMAGLLVGAGGPEGLAGVATGASVLPIRVAGWQQDVAGGWAVYSRTDQLIAGLERAVDPNEDGDAHDAARIALVALAAPYAAFADAPDAQAVQGALALDTLVVAPAGNDCPGRPAFGSLSSPGGSPAALTVGAAAFRAPTEGGRGGAHARP